MANVSALPTISPTHTIVTLLVTDAQGDVATSLSTVALAAATLGLPPGWSNASRLDVHTSISLAVIVGFCAFFLDIFVFFLDG